MSETPELSELTREQLIEIIRESSELVGVMREDRNRVVGELEAVAAENQQLVAEKQARDADLDIIEPSRDQDNTFEEGKALLDRFQEAAEADGFLENTSRKDQLQAELRKQLERAEDLVEDFSKKNEQLKNERDALKLELERTKQAKRIAASEAELHRLKKEETLAVLHEAQQAVDQLQSSLDAAQASLQATTKERDEALAMLSVRKPLDDRGTDTREASKSNSPVSLPRHLRQVLENLEKARLQLETEAGASHHGQTLLASAIEDLRGLLLDNHGAATSHKEESLLLLERRGGFGTSNQASGITLLRADAQKDSQFNSRLPSELSKQSPTNSQMNSEMVKKLNLSPFLAPEQDSQAPEGHFKFSARTFGLQERDFETLQNEDQQTLLARYIRQLKDVSEYAQAKETETGKLAAENQMLREAIEELVHKREKVEEVAERLEDLDKEELLELAKELLEKIENQHSEIESLRRKEPNIFYPSGQDNQPASLQASDTRARPSSPGNKDHTEHLPPRQPSPARRDLDPPEPTSDPIRIVEEIDPDVQKIIDLYEAQISNDRALIEQMKAELEDCNLRLAENESEKLIQNKAVDLLTEQVLDLRQHNKQLLKNKQLQQLDLQDLQLRTHAERSPAPDSDREDIVLQEIPFNHRYKKTGPRNPSFADKENSALRNQTPDATRPTLKDSFGREKLERGLTTIHMKLMEYINKSYSLKTRESQMIHKDLTMKMIDLNRMVEALCDRLNDYKQTDPRNRTTKPQLKPLVAASKRQDRSRDGARAESYHRAADQQNAQVVKRLFTKSTDHKNNRDTGPQTGPAVDPDASTSNKENESQHFLEAVKVLTSNSDVITKRGQDLVSEYRKIDENISQLIRYLSSKKKVPLGKVARYRSLLVDSEYENLKTQIKQIHAQDIEVRVSVRNLLKSAASHLKASVNQIKNKTKDRRDHLASLVLKDQIEVEGLAVTPKHR